jgi:hypothetical protein
VFPRLEVTLQRLKHLQAGANGQILYSPNESIVLDVYANYQERQTQALTMHEGDDVALTIPTQLFNVPLPNVLVLIANIQQQVSYTKDTGWTSALRTVNFSPGVHTLQVTKRYVIPPGPGNTKPFTAHVPAYELTAYNPRAVNGTLGTQPAKVQ